MRIISCVFFKGYYYFILYWVLDIFYSIERDFFEEENNSQYNGTDSNTTNNSSYNNDSNNVSINSPYSREISLLYIQILIIGDFFAGFLVLITKVRMNYLKKNKKNNKPPKPKKNYELIYTDLSEKSNKYILILLISVLDFLGRTSELLYFIFVSTEKLDLMQTSWLIFIDIISRAIFCYLILKIKLKRHHSLSMILCFIGFLIMSYFGIKSLNYNELDDWMYLFFSFLKIIVLALEDSYNKILITNKFVLPHYLMFYRGSVNFIILLIILPILYWTSCINFTNYKYLNLTNALEIFSKLLLIIFSFTKTFCIFKIIDIFTPQHVGFVNVVYCLLEFIKYIIKQNSLGNIFHFIVDMISLIVMIFGTLIFNEMIIVNAFGLDEGTKSGIMKKEKLDNIEMQSSVIYEKDDNQEEKNVSLNDISNENKEKEENNEFINNSSN